MTVSADFEREGYATFRGLLDVAEIGRLEQEILRDYPGPLLRHNVRMARHCELDPNAVFDRSGLLDCHLWSLPELRPFLDALRALLFSQAIYNALHSIDGETRYTLHQSIFFFVSPRTVTHMDHTTLDTTPPARSFTVWIALDNVLPPNGPPYLVPTPRGHYRADTGKPRSEQNEMLAEWMLETTTPTLALTTKAGDFAVWAPSTPHGSMAARPDMAGRRSIQAIYRPTSILQWGNRRERIADFHDVKTEEEEINSRFNCLIGKRADIDERFKQAGFGKPSR
jgi:hypothetical protein